MDSLNVTRIVVALTATLLPVGAFAMTVGRVVSAPSTVQVRAAVAPELPAGSMARTLNVCEPVARPE